MLKLGNDHLTKSAVVSQELQLGILSHRVRATSKKEEESELEGEASSSTHIQRKRPAEESFPTIITPPPNLRDRTPVQHPRVQSQSNTGDDDFDDYNESEEEEEVNENEETSTEVQLIISKMENMEPSAEEKQNTVRRSKWEEASNL
ncbi:6696_t:CDS:2 [Acaulospora colombiana]|uniref:6696_t:CDS:1 n=1 Tax=Acaulospora colombiana TaxID=27376 RepID=A0ACA9KW82_9GLOM|nr:6696_t:CDS:2 [Acaulospora colombiana]